MSAPVIRTCKKYLFHFAQEHTDFRIAELRAILGIFKIQVDISITDPLNPFVVLDLPTEECVKQIVSRSMLVRSVYHLWAQGKTFKELNSNLKSLPKDFLEMFIIADLDTLKGAESIRAWQALYD